MGRRPALFRTVRDGTLLAGGDFEGMETESPPLVLVVEDEPLIRDVASTAISDAGFEVIEAASAAEALDVLRTRADVGVLFTDVDMPGSLDGLELATLVHEQWPAIQLVVTSGRGLRGPVPDDGRFVPKPYRLDDMIETVALVAKRLT